MCAVKFEEETTNMESNTVPCGLI